MARLHAASERVRAHFTEGLARPFVDPLYQRFMAADVWIRRLIPVLVGLFLAIAGAGAAHHLIAGQEFAAQALRDATALLLHQAGAGLAWSSDSLSRSGSFSSEFTSCSSSAL